MLARNPGVGVLWITRSYKVVRAEHGGAGILFEIGDAEAVHLYCQGRPATRREVLDSIDSGMPFLRELAVKDGDAATRELDRCYNAAMQLLPAA
jgi:hypothetical protein